MKSSKRKRKQLNPKLQKAKKSITKVHSINLFFPIFKHFFISLFFNLPLFLNITQRCLFDYISCLILVTHQLKMDIIKKECMELTIYKKQTKTHFQYVCNLYDYIHKIRNNFRNKQHSAGYCSYKIAFL